LRLKKTAVRLYQGSNRYKLLRARRPKVKALFKQAKGVQTARGRRVLCWDPSPYPVLSAMINSVGLALALRGAEVETVLCDGPRDICQGATLDTGITDEAIGRWRENCPGCYLRAKFEARSFLLKTCAVGDLVSPEAVVRSRKLADGMPLDELFDFEYRGVQVGRHAKAEVIRHYVDKVAEKDWRENIIRECFFTALVITDAARVKIDSFKPDAVYMVHAQYAPWGPAYDLAAARGIPVVRIQSGYFPSMSRFRIFADGQPVGPRTPSEIRWEKMKNIPLTRTEDEVLNNYLWRRYNKTARDEAFINNNSNESGDNRELGLGNAIFPSLNPRAVSRAGLISRLGLDDKKPIWCIFPNVAWDAALQEVPKAFPRDREWLIETVKAITEIPEVQWIIKVHPRKPRNWPDIYDISGTLIEHFGSLPGDLAIIPSDTDINTYDIFDLVSGGVFYVGNTASTELTMLGKPAILAGEAMSAKRGFTYDAVTPEEYIGLLKKAPSLPGLTEEETRSARRLAYYFFVETQIPLRMMKVERGLFHSFDWDKLDLLYPGEDPFIDEICAQFFSRDDVRLPPDLIGEAIQVWG